VLANAMMYGYTFNGSVPSLTAQLGVVSPRTASIASSAPIIAE
jgi:hypothetical protein